MAAALEMVYRLVLESSEEEKVIWFCPSSERYLKKRHCLSWHTSKPSPGRTLESNVFCFHGIRCWLSLTCKTGWYKLRLNYGEDVDCRPPDCSVAVYLEKSSSGYILPEFSNKRFFLRPTTCIWRCPETHILSQIPDFVQENRLSFLIIEDNFKPALSLGTEASEESDLRLLVTYAGSCLNVLADEVWKILHEQSDHDIELICDAPQLSTQPAIIMASRDDICKHSLVIREGLHGHTFKTNHSSEDLEEFLVCLHAGKVPDDTRESVVRGLYRMANSYSVEWLVHQCRELLLKKMTAVNVAKILFVASCNKDLALREAATKYIVDNKVPMTTLGEEEITVFFDEELPRSKPKSDPIRTVPNEKEYFDDFFSSLWRQGVKSKKPL